MRTLTFVSLSNPVLQYILETELFYVRYSCICAAFIALPLYAVWHGVMFIRQGLYQGGVYRFQLFIPDTYPDADCPVRDLLPANRAATTRSPPSLPSHLCFPEPHIRPPCVPPNNQPNHWWARCPARFPKMEVSLQRLHSLVISRVEPATNLLSCHDARSHRCRCLCADDIR